MIPLLLVGAGHTHLHLVRRAAALADAGYRVRLLAPRSFHYSGVASATAAGDLAPETGRVDVRALAAACGVELHEGVLADLDLQRRVAVTDRGDEVPYEVLSLNIGSVVHRRGMHVDPAVLTAKPLTGLAALDERLREASGHGRGPGATATVVGGGATGVELAAHLAVRPDVARVRLVHSGDRVGADLPPGARRWVTALLATRGVEVRTGHRVQRLGAARVELADGTVLPHDVALLATGLAAPPLLAELGLGDERGVPVRETLQHEHHDEVYAVGDCARFLPRPLPRLGVHGVRQGPVLLESLLARQRGRSLPRYRPPRRALSVLDLGGGTGLAVRGRWWWPGAAALRLKRTIDRRWLATYQLDRPGSARGR